MFANRSRDSKTGEAKENGSELFDHLTEVGHSHGQEGMRVEVRVAPDENSLQVRLLDDKSRAIDSATLKNGTAVVLSGGKLILHGYFSGLHGRSGNFGFGLEYEHDTLQLSTNGGLLGSSTSSKAGLLMDFIPVAGTEKDSLFWPKLAK